MLWTPKDSYVWIPVTTSIIIKGILHTACPHPFVLLWCNGMSFPLLICVSISYWFSDPSPFRTVPHGMFLFFSTVLSPDQLLRKRYWPHPASWPSRPYDFTARYVGFSSATEMILMLLSSTRSFWPGGLSIRVPHCGDDSRWWCSVSQQLGNLGVLASAVWVGKFLRHECSTD